MVRRRSRTARYPSCPRARLARPRRRRRRWLGGARRRGDATLGRPGPRRRASDVVRSRIADRGRTPRLSRRAAGESLHGLRPHGRLRVDPADGALRRSGRDLERCPVVLAGLVPPPPRDGAPPRPRPDVGPDPAGSARAGRSVPRSPAGPTVLPERSHGHGGRDQPRRADRDRLPSRPGGRGSLWGRRAVHAGRRQDGAPVDRRRRPTRPREAVRSGDRCGRRRPPRGRRADGDDRRPWPAGRRPPGTDRRRRCRRVHPSRRPGRRRPTDRAVPLVVARRLGLHRRGMGTEPDRGSPLRNPGAGNRHPGTPQQCPRRTFGSTRRTGPSLGGTGRAGVGPSTDRSPGLGGRRGGRA